MGPYVRIGFRETFRYRAGTYRVTLDGEEIVSNALVIAFANGREYGNRIRVAPQALVDDGKLEAVVVEDRGPLGAAVGRPSPGAGDRRQGRGRDRCDRSSRRGSKPTATSSITSTARSAARRASVTVRIRPRVLKVRVP